MHIDKQFVIEELRKAGKDEHVQKALDELPETSDHAATNSARRGI